MNILDMKPHPLAAAMPPLDDYAKKALERSMGEQGFDPRFPVVVWLDPKIGEDRILGGVNRRDTAKKLGLDRIPIVRFEGDHKAAARWVYLEQIARRSPDKSQRALIVSKGRLEGVFEGSIEQLAQMAGCSISQMEKASAIVHKSKKFTTRGILREMSVSQIHRSAELRHVPETSAAGEDPYKEIERTREKFEAFMEDLVALVQRQFDPLLDRRGGEMVKLSVAHRLKNKSHGLAIFDAVLQQIRRNLPKQRCTVCGGGGCATCGNRMYQTAHEVAAAKNAERSQA